MDLSESFIKILSNCYKRCPAKESYFCGAGAFCLLAPYWGSSAPYISFGSRSCQGSNSRNRERWTRAVALPLDVMLVSSFDAFVTSLISALNTDFGTDKIDYLVNNGWFIYHIPFTDVTVEQFDDLLNIHFKGPFFLTQKLLGSINDNGGLVNVSTGLARFSTPGFATYASMKGAIETLTKYQAQELGTRGIRSNVIAPGAIEKEMNANLASNTALGRVGLPHDIGGVVAFLCTDDAKWVNGQRIEISGGYNL